MSDGQTRAGDAVRAPETAPASISLFDSGPLRPSHEAETEKGDLVGLAYAAIKRAILDNLLPPGYQAAEVAIAKKLGMSRTPVHEAISRLQEEGLLRILPRRGIVVCALTPEDVVDIYEVIIALEGAAAERIALLPQEERETIAEKLRAPTRAMKEALDRDDRRAWAIADEEFHTLLLSNSGNRRLHRMASTVINQLHRVRMFTLNLRSNPSRSPQEHEEIIEAILAGDAEKANGAARSHRRYASTQVVPVLKGLNIRNF